MRAPRGLVLGGLVLALAPLVGCSSLAPEVCPAVAWGSTAAIALEVPRAGLTLEVCDGDGCVIRAESDRREAGTGDDAHISGTSEDGWQVSFILGGEPVIGYRVTDGAGGLVAEGHAPADWVRVDGSEQCGGNREAQITLPV